MNPYVITAALIGYGIAIAGGFKLGVDHEVASQHRADKHIAQAVDAANNAAAHAISKIKVTHQVINNKIQHETSTATIYRDPDCRNTLVGLQLINYALTNSQPADSGIVPTTEPAK